MGLAVAGNVSVGASCACSSARWTSRPDWVRSGTSLIISTANSPITSTAAAERNTTLVAPANPSRIGRASAGSAVDRNDESSRGSAFPCGAPRMGALAGSAATCGSATAARNAGSAAAARCWTTWPLSVLNSSDRKTAVPSVPPI